MRKFCFLTLFFLILILSPNHALSQNSLIYSERSAVGSLNPYTVPEIRPHFDRVYSLLYEGLYRYNHIVSDFTPVLADGSPERIAPGVYRIALRNDVMWHDGQRFNANDVEFTYRYLMQQGANQALRSFFTEGIAEVSAVDNSIVEFRFHSTVTDVNPYLNTWIIPSHLFNPGTFSPVSQQSNIANNPIGTGKYIFQSRSRQTQGIEFGLHSRHHTARPQIESITLERSRDLDTRIQRLLNRSVDLLTDIPANRISQIESAGSHSLEPYQTYNITVIGFNMNHAVLRNMNIRQAMVHGTNREQMLNQWYAGRGEVIHGPFARAANYFRADLPQLEYSRTRAEQMIQQAGYSRSGGFYQDSNGRRLSFRLLTQIVDDPSDLAQQNVAENFRDLMRNIGIEIEIVSKVYDDYIISLYDGDFDMVLINYVTDETYDISTFFQSGGVRNFLSYSNREVDTHFERFRQTNNPATRQLEMSRIQEILAVEVPYMFLFNLERNAAIDRRFLNTIIDPRYFFTDVDQWIVDY